MKNITETITNTLGMSVGMTMLLVSCAMMPSEGYAESDVTANIGYASEYYYRGIYQKESSASAGIDYTNSNGWYAGTWTADVGDGVEIDGYFGYGIETTRGITASVGYTGYFYTGDFDETYEEINLNLGYDIFGLEHSIGEWEDQDYSYTAVSANLPNGIYGKYGRFDNDFDGDHVEVGYGTEVQGLDIGLAFIFSSKEISDEGTTTNPEIGEAVILTVSKTI